MRVRRHVTRGLDWSRLRALAGRTGERLRTFAGGVLAGDRRFWYLAGGLAVAGVVMGYVIAATLFFPAPIFATSRGVPRVIGLERDAAATALEQAGFAVVEGDRVPHPSVPAGAVVWQEPPGDVVVPEGTEIQLTLSAGPQRVPVPDVAGYDAGLARTLLEAAGLEVGSVEQTQAPTPRNVAVNTRPPAGATLPPGARVTLVVSVGAPTIRVPSVVGLTLDDARVALETAGLQLGTSYARTTSSGQPGRVFHQDPPGGTLSAPGTQVNVILVRRSEQ